MGGEFLPTDIISTTVIKLCRTPTANGNSEGESRDVGEQRPENKPRESIEGAYLGWF
jgi:hypothetical protein